ncbi:DUF551 domain-containing protein [Rosenbergiella collisarenosi]|uniref:DUF551 domain-containing protein n=1 Tax=Rosenbergiella collisarenosi TaxID=1544695 RepID=UPI001F4FD17D|nr:DUF551 domain-containing protein [Rosenbergiella collisarenosi]
MLITEEALNEAIEGKRELGEVGLRGALKELRDFRQGLQWISVSEKLPDKEAWYLVKTVFNDSRYEVQCWDDKGRTWLGDDYSYELDDITHYMPIPK